MSTTITTATAQPVTTSRPAYRPIWAATVIGGVVAAAATTAIAAVAGAAGVSFEVDGEAIPLLGFTQLTMVAAIVGGLIATALARWARRPQRTFVVTTGVLTALSLVPDLTFGFDAASAVVLMATHLVAAAVVIPAIAARLAR